VEGSGWPDVLGTGPLVAGLESFGWGSWPPVAAKVLRPGVAPSERCRPSGVGRCGGMRVVGVRLPWVLFHLGRLIAGVKVILGRAVPVVALRLWCLSV